MSWARRLAAASAREQNVRNQTSMLALRAPLARGLLMALGYVPQRVERPLSHQRQGQQSRL